MKSISVRMTADDLKALSDEAKKLRVSLSAIIRMKLVKVIEAEVQAV